MDRPHNLFVSSDGSVESGWTVYLENSSSSLFSKRIRDSFDVRKDEEEEEELDLSMVSDASSGPPIFPESEDVFQENEIGRCRKIKGGEDRRCHGDRHEKTASFLDDTASSDPDFKFHNLESSTSCQNQFNAMRQPSLSGNQRQKNQWLNRKRSGLRQTGRSTYR